MTEVNATKGDLAQSLKTLMQEKSFSKISITDICELCNLNRKSFYYHFKDKYDLLTWIFYNDFITTITGSHCENGWDLIEQVCVLLYNDQDFYREAFKIDGQNSFREYLLDSMLPIISYLFGDVTSIMEKLGFSDKMMGEILIITLANWMADGCKTRPGEFVQILKDLVKSLGRDL